MSIHCPICEKDDAIQKVSSIVLSGNTSGTYTGPTGGVVTVGGKTGYSGGFTTMRGSSSTHLAQLLEPPKEPSKPKSSGCIYIVVGGLAGG